MFSWVSLATVLIVGIAVAESKRKFDGDFEFAEEVSWRIHTIILIVASQSFVRNFTNKSHCQRGDGKKKNKYN